MFYKLTNAIYIAREAMLCIFQLKNEIPDSTSRSIISRGVSPNYRSGEMGALFITVPYVILCH